MADSSDTLKKLIEKIAKEQNYTQARITIDPITSGGANYTTNLYLIKIAETFKPDIHLFAKVANLNEEFRAKNEIMAKVYLIETMFYTELVVNFERIYKKNNVPEEYKLTMPKYFGHDITKLKETLVLENLAVTGFQNYDRMKTFNWEYASTAVQQLARFHALGLAFRDENPNDFERIVGQFKTENDNMHEFLKQAVKNGCEAVDKEYRERLLNYFSTTDVIPEMVQRFDSDKTMLIHGDFRPSNMMHRRKNGKLEIIPLDYQTLRLGNPVGDLMHFIFSGSDEEFRQLHYEQLLDHYHAELTLALQRLQIDVEKVYSKKTFEQDLSDLKPLGLILGLTIIGIVTVAPEEAPKMETDLTEMTIKPNELAQERIRGIARDYIRWGVI